MEALWTIDELAAYLKVPKETIYAWRKRGDGPPPVRGGKLGRHLRWEPQTVRDWLHADAVA